jgi:hypothetical protein
MGLEGRPTRVFEAKSYVLAVDEGLPDGPYQVRRWDGGSWLTVGGEFDGPIRDLAVYNGHLTAAGEFTDRVARIPLDQVE